MQPSRRSLGLMLVAPALLSFGVPASAEGQMVVYRDENCGCCGNWVDYIRAAGFEVDVRIFPFMNRKKTELGIPSGLRSCHTALIGGYLLEGHVPVEEIRRLLASRPNASGLAVPRMPVGSPGMEVEGVAPDRYNVLLFQGQRTSVFATYVGAVRQPNPA